jgi:hypothetical protein
MVLLDYHVAAFYLGNARWDAGAAPAPDAQRRTILREAVAAALAERAGGKLAQPAPDFVRRAWLHDHLFALDELSGRLGALAMPLLDRATIFDASELPDISQSTETPTVPERGASLLYVHTSPTVTHPYQSQALAAGIRDFLQRQATGPALLLGTLRMHGEPEAPRPPLPTAEVSLLPYWRPPQGTAIQDYVFGKALRVYEKRLIHTDHNGRHAQLRVQTIMGRRLGNTSRHGAIHALGQDKVVKLFQMAGAPELGWERALNEARDYQALRARGMDLIDVVGPFISEGVAGLVIDRKRLGNEELERASTPAGPIYVGGGAQYFNARTAVTSRSQWQGLQLAGAAPRDPQHQLGFAGEAHVFDPNGLEIFGRGNVPADRFEPLFGPAVRTARINLASGQRHDPQPDPAWQPSGAGRTQRVAFVLDAWAHNAAAVSAHPTVAQAKLALVESRALNAAIPDASRLLGTPAAWLYLVPAASDAPARWNDVIGWKPLDIFGYPLAAFTPRGNG